MTPMLENVLKNPLPLLVLGVLFLFVVGLAAALFKKRTTAPDDHPYESAGQLLSPAERSFLGVLQLGLNSDFLVLPKVRLADVIHVRNGLTSSRFRQALNRISLKHVDFLICRKADFSIAGVVELDDQSHQRSSRAARDRFLDKALAAAAVPVLHVKAQSRYESRAIAAELEALLTDRARPGLPTFNSQLSTLNSA